MPSEHPRLSDEQELPWPAPQAAYNNLAKAREELTWKTRGILVEAFPRQKTIIRATPPHQLIYGLKKHVTTESTFLEFEHGIEIATDQNLYVPPTGETYDAINSLTQFSRVQIARSVMWEFIEDEISARNEDLSFEQELDDQEEEFEMGRSNAWEESQKEEEIPGIEISSNDAAFLIESLDEELRLREIYEAIVRGKLGAEHVSLRAT